MLLSEDEDISACVAKLLDWLKMNICVFATVTMIMMCVFGNSGEN